jgi:tRNA uridine 5-carboxymethylaminomethyl modification enzyme
MRFGFNQPYEVIVCGAGHAGCEAALAAARRGADTLILTGNIDTVAAMSCNPAIGGLAKGNIVREIDALGGAMAMNTDYTAIQFRLLNASKGLAVQGPRAQCDKKAYQLRMKHILERQQHLTLFQAIVTELIYKNGVVIGVKTNLDLEFYAKAVIITTGTFLRGLMHIGTNKNEGGRLGDFTAKTLSGSLQNAGIKLERLKTGTPPRILGSTIDFTDIQEQPGDESPTLFAFHDTRSDESEECSTWNKHKSNSSDVPRGTSEGKEHLLGWLPGSNQMSCWISHTTGKTAEIVRRNLHRSALYGGSITGTGPRYCPSIEDKIVKFVDKEQHRIFLEPEGRNTNEWYINGLSTSLPFDVQVDLVHSVKGLEHSQLLRPAYAVEYDFAPPQQLFPSLESRIVENLFMAGQINGTSGYEEAAGQGIIAGINAVAKIRYEEPLILGRHIAYIGVLIDDLVTKGTHEPYRMFTSRAEHRLLLNHGSSEFRLYSVAKQYHLIDNERLGNMSSKICLFNEWVEKFETQKTRGGTFAEAQRRGEGDCPPGFDQLPIALKEEILYKVCYKGYIDREAVAIGKMDDLEKVVLPTELDYLKVPGLRKESAIKLRELRPINLAQASRISGVNPTDVTILMLAVKKSTHKS